ncbi:hypothetical protein HDE_11831 [Halotydeus destructor]|nr:hypothetical protein HDE_11831 [Halotydeus destructor]
MDSKSIQPEMMFGIVAEPAIDPEETVPIRTQENQEPNQRRNTNFSDLGLPRPKKKTVNTFIGTFRSCNNISKSEWFYLTVSLLSLIGIVGLTIERIVSLIPDIQDPYVNDGIKADFIFGVLLAWTSFFCFYHLIVGLLCERFYDLLVFVVTILIILIYVVINYLTSPLRNDTKLARLIVACVVCPVLIAGGLFFIRKYFQSGNLIFNTVGANSAVQKMCRQVFLLDSVIKLDFQLGGSTLILWLQKSFIDKNFDQIELIIVAVGVIESIIWVILGFFAIRLEKRSLVYAFYATSIIEPMTIIGNLYRTVIISDHGAKSLVYATYACGLLALAVRVFALYSMSKVRNNFGKGLREKIFGDPPTDQDRGTKDQPHAADDV